VQPCTDVLWECLARNIYRPKFQYFCVFICVYYAVRAAESVVISRGFRSTVKHKILTGNHWRYAYPSFYIIINSALCPKSTLHTFPHRWIGGVVVRAPDSWPTDRGFDSRPLHCRATTLSKLFTPMCLCLPSSIIWYLARAFMSTRHMWQPMAWSPMNKGSIVVAVLQRSWSLRTAI